MTTSSKSTPSPTYRKHCNRALCHLQLHCPTSRLFCRALLRLIRVSRNLSSRWKSFVLTEDGAANASRIRIIAPRIWSDFSPSILLNTHQQGRDTVILYHHGRRPEQNNALLCLSRMRGLVAFYFTLISRASITTRRQNTRSTYYVVLPHRRTSIRCCC